MNEHTTGQVAASAAVVTEILADLLGPETAQSIEMPYSMGDKQKLLSLFAEASVAEATIQTILGQAHFTSVEDWIYTDIKGWTLADIIDDEGYKRLQAYAPQKLAHFVEADGSVCFAAPAHIVTAVSPQ